ncbi:hypothetical protein QTG54_001683 [Skeletonema marinoi]|uniref:Dynein heavy chain tail domain-containing protein n=1 Tax=Skeletonema marinoi TaxID=267567 RepID=A0AAD9DJ79_9STRA|nr:hypothetical protein QTG54_001683 [Skeletonema marinoi]
MKVGFKFLARRASKSRKQIIWWKPSHSFFFLLIEESNPTSDPFAMSDDPASIWDDPRVNFVVQCIQSTHSKLSPGAKFDKLFRTEATCPIYFPPTLSLTAALCTFIIHSEILEQFFSDGTLKCILVPENLKIVAAMPNRLPKMKCLAISKTHDELTVDNIRSATFIAEIGGMSSFEHLELVSKNVLLPVLSNQTNKLNWGDLTSREITNCFHSLCRHRQSCRDELPTPLFDDDKSSSDEKSSSNRLSLLEGTILTWTKQIKSVLKQDPEAQLKLGMHPTPDVEIAFWKKKSNNLNSIFEQLQSPEIRRILRVLDEAQSTYCTAFARLCKEVYSARLEANDNVRHLRPLEKWINKLNEEDFGNLTTVFKPMLHILMLIWKHSKHYNTPNRLVVLVQEMCNSIIDQAHRSISGEQIFSLIDNEEANVAVEELSTVLKVCGKFKKTYLDYKARVATECDHEWNVHNGALFARLDCFMERCHDVLDMTQTIIQFSKLAKVEIGGTKGTTLTATIQQIKNDFKIQ